MFPVDMPPIICCFSAPIIPNAGHYHEYKGYRGVENCVPGGLQVKNGRIRVPDGSGLGLEINFLDSSQTECVFDIR